MLASLPQSLEMRPCCRVSTSCNVLTKTTDVCASMLARTKAALLCIERCSVFQRCEPSHTYICQQPRFPAARSRRLYGTKFDPPGRIRYQYLKLDGQSAMPLFSWSLGVLQAATKCNNFELSRSDELPIPRALGMGSGTVLLRSRCIE